jgi:hypothetical protein
MILIAGCATQKSANVKSAEETKLITDIVTSEDAESTIVTVKGGPTLTYTAIKQVFPLGVLFHFPETALDKIKEVYYPPQTDIIGSIRATQIEEDGATSRVFIALKRDLPYNITPDETGIHISFPKTGELAEKTSAPEPPAEKMDEQPKPEKKMAAAATRITAIGTTPLKKSVVINVSMLKPMGLSKTTNPLPLKKRLPESCMTFTVLKARIRESNALLLNPTG